MFTVLLDTTDLSEAEAVLSANFSKIRLQRFSDGDCSTLHLERSLIGSVGLNVADYGLTFSYEMDPPERILLCRVVSGGLEERVEGGHTTFVQPGQVAALGALDGLYYSGRVQRGQYDQLVIEPSLLGEVAAGPPGSDEPVRLTGATPVSPAAGRHLFDTIGFLRRVAADNYLDQNPLLAAGLERYLATVLLNTLPNTASLELSAQDKQDSTPLLLRRAIAFIDENAHTDISLPDVASAVFVSPRALQYMFRKHRGCTPMEYVRQVRLHYAHLDLVAGDRTTTTVSEIARRWGFGHMGRFSVYYRENYGESPHVALAAD